MMRFNTRVLAVKWKLRIAVSWRQTNSLKKITTPLSSIVILNQRELSNTCMAQKSTRGPKYSNYRFLTGRTFDHLSLEVIPLQ